MTFGWIERTHDRITIKAISPIEGLSDSDKTRLVEFVREPDKMLPFNLINHVQDTSGYGNAKNKIIEEFNNGTLKGLGHSIHYLQDICNPIHTMKDYPITKHIAYEISVRDEYIDFVPNGRFEIFKDGIDSGIDDIINYPAKSTSEALKRAAYATYELVNLWLMG